MSDPHPDPTDPGSVDPETGTDPTGAPVENPSGGDGSDPDALPSGAGPQAEGDQSDIASGGGTDE